MSDTLSAESALQANDSPSSDTAPAPEAPAPSEPLAFKKAFHYPFNRAVGLLNIFWMLVPLFGWFAVMGYTIRIVRGFTEGRFEELPKLEFWSDCGFGFKMFFKMIPFFFVYGFVIGVLGAIVEAAGLPSWTITVPDVFVNVFILPLLTMNFFRKGTVSSFFEFGILSAVFSNLGDYAKAILKDIGLFLVFFVMFIVLVGIPAAAFTKNIFLADFYRRRVG